MELESLIEEIADTDSDLFEIGVADFLEAKCLVGCYTSVVVQVNEDSSHVKNYCLDIHFVPYLDYARKTTAFYGQIKALFIKKRMFKADEFALQWAAEGIFSQVYGRV